MTKVTLDGIAELQSGNSTPVERATFTRERMAEILKAHTAERVREALEEAAQKILDAKPPHHPKKSHAIEIGRDARQAYAHLIRTQVPPA